MSGVRGVLSFYARIARTYWAWAPSLLLLAAIVFLPLGLIDALSVTLDVDSLDLDSGFKIAAVIAAVSALAATSLLGEVFYSGAIAVALIHPEGEPAPSLREVARRLDYKHLIAVDLIYVALVVVGLLVFFVPGALAFVYLGLAGPAVEIEGHGVRAALARSWHLVRGRFWFVAAILVPIEIVGDAIGEAAGHEVHQLLGDTFIASWLAGSVSNFLFSPVFAVAAVLLTVQLIAEKDGEGPSVNLKPQHSQAAAA
ncbi:MAG TPA: hypothetical protein VMS60_04955 [Solirubrobacterales bacterium]|nr:hypothetical protein [Solirubrobacterales bacterium]